MTKPTLKLEKSLHLQGQLLIAGIDEVGWGALAGPVVAAAVIFPPHHKPIKKVNDSKLLSPATREALALRIKLTALSYGIGIASVSKINTLGIVPATFLAMKRAINQLNQVSYLLIDGPKCLPDYDLATQQAIIKGDRLCYSIAAASILAKVHRDSLMTKLHLITPHYAWASNKGYSTRSHRLAIYHHGLSSHHRQLFVRKIIQSLS
jgi:ribonuclease HII